MVAALFVETNGIYFGLPNVDPWDVRRDARQYAGTHPVVAHPPCDRWCQMAPVNQARYGHRVGDDGGTFSAALAAVRRWGGVLEHPAVSLAWAAFDLPRPPSSGGMGSWLLRRLVSTRRAEALWTPSTQGDVALCLRCRVAGSAMGKRITPGGMD